MAGTRKRVGPTLLTTTLTTNIYQGAAASAALVDEVTHVEVVNRTGSIAKVSLWVGATGANASGTESFFGTAQSVQPNSKVDWYGNKVLKSTDFVVGGSDSASALVITLELNQNVVP